MPFIVFKAVSFHIKLPIKYVFGDEPNCESLKIVQTVAENVAALSGENIISLSRDRVT